MKTTLVARLVACLLLAGLLIPACNPQAFIAIMPGVINDPANRTLRRELLAFGTKTLCKELLQRSVPLKLRDEDPTTGRFFPRTCKLEPLENGDLYVQFGGVGYAWSNLTKRISFTASAAVHFEQDFRLDGSTMYIYFRPRSITAKKFELRMVEQQAVPPATVAPLFPGGTPESFMNHVGEGLLARELGRGFTVIRESDGTAAFGIGLIPVGERPAEPFERRGASRELVANESIEIHDGQRDYVGPINVTDDDLALYVTMEVTGAPQVDLLVVPRRWGEPWLESYMAERQAPAAPAPALLDETVVATTSLTSIPARPHKRLIRLTKGSYFLVLDNTATAGRSAPAQVAMDDRAVLVSLGLELGDAP